MAKQNNNSAEFVNPFSEGITYEKFLSAIPEGTSARDYLKEKVLIKIDETLEEKEAAISWLEKELVAFKYNAENKEAFLAKARAEHAELIKEK